MDVPELYRRASDAFGEHVRAVRNDQWHAPTPCSDWDVRTLVNHIVNEELWVPELLAGKTVDEVGDRFDGDVLGDNPAASWEAAAGPAVDAIQADGAMTTTTHLSFGDFPGEQYALQIFADHLVHGWDLATAIGADTKLDPEQVQAGLEWFEAVEDDYRAAGAIGERPPIADGASPQTVLLAMFGRSG
jgi:uncharacterized protein (TIGR03086 family)